MGDAVQSCANCKKTATELNTTNLKNCAKCKVTLYCCRDCQKADWKAHKKVCASQANAGAAANTANSSSYSAPPLKCLEKHVPNPFTRLDQGSFLHDRPENDVYKLLIDSFRMRQADDFNFENKTMPRSVYTGAASSMEPFREYIAKAATISNLLPPWWSPAKQTECEAFGESGAWSDLRKKVTKQDIINHYGDDKAPMQVRMLAEAVYGIGSMGQSGGSMRKFMSQMEQGGPGNGQVASMINIDPFKRR